MREAPEIARAWAALTTAKLEVLRLARADRARLVEDARDAAHRAIGIDPTLGEAYAVLAALESDYFGRWQEREALFDKALEVEPNTPLLLFRHGQFLVSVGRVAEGYAQQASAFERDPLDPMLAAFHGYNVWARVSKAEGRAILDAAAARNPDNVPVWFMRLNTAALDGDFATANALRAEAARLAPGLTASASYKAGERAETVAAAAAPAAAVGVTGSRVGSTVTATDDEKLSWMWPSDGRIIATFDEGKSKGIDIAGRAGQQVMAAGAGKVMYAGSGIRGYGNLVIVKHSNSLLSAYAHNRAIVVKEGDNVAKGQVIAEMGDSDAETVKLHFEIRQQGKPVDPSRFLPSR